MLAVVTLLPIAAGASRAALALRGPERHVCACPIDDDGNCQCPDCIRLEIHGPRDDAHEHDHRSSGPTIASGCESPPHVTPPPPAIDLAVVPERIDLPPHASGRAHGARPHARAPDEPGSDPEVPPPRLA